MRCEGSVDIRAVLKKIQHRIKNIAFMFVLAIIHNGIVSSYIPLSVGNQFHKVAYPAEMSVKLFFFLSLNLYIDIHCAGVF